MQSRLAANAHPWQVRPHGARQYTNHFIQPTAVLWDSGCHSIYTTPMLLIPQLCRLCRGIVVMCVVCVCVCVGVGGGGGGGGAPLGAASGACHFVAAAGFVGGYGAHGTLLGRLLDGCRRLEVLLLHGRAVECLAH